MKLDAYRRDKGLSLEQLAAKLGVGGRNPVRTVQRYVTGERVPGRAMMRAIEVVTEGAVTDADFPLRVKQSAQPVPQASV